MKIEENIYNDKFIDLIRDDKFVQLVRSCDKTDLLLKELLLKNSKNSENIRYAFEFILLTKNDRKRLSDSESDVILRGIEKKMQHKILDFSYHMAWKIAAVAFVVLSLGSLILYHQCNKDPFKKYSEVNQKDVLQSMIILSDGSKHLLSENESKIDYTVSKDNVVINEINGKGEKVIKNKSNSGKIVMNQVAVPFGQQQDVVLSDGTIVRLNSGSRLIFPSSFSDSKKREVTLIGEGFFNVHKDYAHPFIVKTTFMKVKVLGTTFDLCAYKDENTVAAVLVEGSVRVYNKNDESASRIITLTPGEGCFYSVNKNKSEIKRIDTEFYTSWTDGVYQFKNVSLIEVIEKLEKYYNVYIETEEKELLKTKISGKLIITGNINEAMQYLAKTLERKYVKNNKGVFVLKKNK